MTEVHAFGIGAGATDEAAVARARVAVAETIGVEVRSRTRETMRLEEKQGRTVDEARFESESEVKVAKILEGCQVVDRCTAGGDEPARALVRCFRKTRDEREAASRAVIATYPVCSADHPWSRTPPSATSAFVFGVGSSPLLDAAENDARRRAAEFFGVDVRARTSDRQVLWQRGAASEEASTFEDVAESVVAKRLAGCQLVDRCRAESGGVASVLVRCDRASAFEREVGALASKLSARIPARARVLLVPGTNERGRITALGEAVASALRAGLGEGLAREAAVVPSAPWRGARLADVAATAGATHLVRVVHRAPNASGVPLDVWIEEVARAQGSIGGPHLAATVGAEEPDAALGAVLGPMLESTRVLLLVDEARVGEDKKPTKLDAPGPCAAPLRAKLADAGFEVVAFDPPKGLSLKDAFDAPPGRLAKLLGGRVDALVAARVEARFLNRLCPNCPSFYGGEAQLRAVDVTTGAVLLERVETGKKSAGSTDVSAATKAAALTCEAAAGPFASALRDR